MKYNYKVLRWPLIQLDKGHPKIPYFVAIDTNIAIFFKQREWVYTANGLFEFILGNTN